MADHVRPVEPGVARAFLHGHGQPPRPRRIGDENDRHIGGQPARQKVKPNRTGLDRLEMQRDAAAATLAKLRTERDGFRPVFLAAGQHIASVPDGPELQVAAADSAVAAAGGHHHARASRARRRARGIDDADQDRRLACVQRRGQVCHPAAHSAASRSPAPALSWARMSSRVRSTSSGVVGAFRSGAIW